MAVIVLNIEPLDRKDLPKIIGLLQACGLPIDDCADCIDSFAGCYRSDQLIAVGAIQAAENFGQLRSLAVAPELRKQGLALKIIEHLIGNASRDGIDQLYLLTETATDFFVRNGFSMCDRNSAPPVIQRLKQFSSICPASADCLTLKLG